MQPADELVLHWLDLLVVASVLVVLTGVAFFQWLREKPQDLNDFFVAGRKIPWWAVGVSLMAALNSGVDYLMLPSSVVKFGMYILVANLTWLFLYPYVSYVTLPLYRSLGVISAYEYLERRFSAGVRSLVAGLFILWRLGWMAMALYVPPLAISTASGGRIPLIPTIIVLGALVTSYTMMGGIRAVIWANVTQFCIMFAGVACPIIVVLWEIEGGFTQILANFSTVGDAAQTTLAPEMATGGTLSRVFGYFTIPMTLGGMFITVMVGRVANYTSDQVMVQRFRSTRTIGQARRGFVLTAVTDTIWTTSLLFLGLALFTFFQDRFGAIPSWLMDSPDQIFPYFMAQVFPIGLTGLVVAAILAASLSSLDSSISSITSVAMVDFYERRFVGKRAAGTQLTAQQKRHQVRVSRWITLVIGVVGTALSCNVSRVGTLLEISARVVNCFSGAILAVFLLGMFVRRCEPISVWAGGLAGALVALYVAFVSSLGFLWPAPFGFAATLIVGSLLSLFTGRPGSDRASRWNWFVVTSHYRKSN